MPETDATDATNAKPFYCRDQCMRMNLAFACAMLLARKAGSERFTLGPRVDETPFVPARIKRAPTGSLIGSSGALCTESGDGVGWADRARHSAGARVGGK